MGILGSIALAAAGCTERLSQIELVIGTDAPRERLVALRVFVGSSEATLSELRARADREMPLWQHESAGGQRAADGLIGSVGVLPKDRAQLDPVLLLVRGRVAATSNAPEAIIDRAVFVRFSRGLRGTTRVMLSLRCADTATGCASSPCTVSTRCIEQGLTCGESGQCVEPEVPVVYGDGGAPDGEVPGDGSTGRTVLAPRLIAPLSTSVATASRPEFRWQNGAGALGARVEVCRDRACSMVLETFVASGERGQPTRPLPRGATLFWRAKGRTAGDESAAWSPVWQLRSRAIDGALASTSSGVTGDYNGDGFADLVIAGENAVGATEPVTVNVHAGSAQGPAPAPSAQLTERDRGISFGSSAIAIGDVNGDGFGDLAIASHRWRDMASVIRGRVQVHFGSATGLSVAPNAAVYGQDAGVFFGQSLAGVGDLNGDGYADLAVAGFSTEPREATYRGSAWVYFGGPDGVSDARRVRLLPRAVDVEFGASVGAMGDVDGDGFAELAVAGVRMNGADRDSVVYFFRGGASGLESEPFDEQIEPQNDTLGEPVAHLGDVNGDGLADFALANWSRRRALVMVGRRAARPLLLQRIERDNAETTRFSEAMAGGDVNGDGFDDLALGEPSISTGSAWLYLSDGRSALIESAQLRAASPMDRGWFGCSAAAGDLNGDGRAELCFGARTTVIAGMNEAGLVRCMGLTFTGSTATPVNDRTFEGAFASQWYGNQLSM